MANIQTEFVERLDKSDPRYEKLFYYPRGIKKAGGKIPDDKIDEPLHLQSKK